MADPADIDRQPPLGFFNYAGSFLEALNRGIRLSPEQMADYIYRSGFSREQRKDNAITQK